MSVNTPAPNINTQKAESDEGFFLSSSEVSPEQNRYASILLVCSWAGICIMTVTFLLYVVGFLNPLVEPSAISSYWTMNVHQFAKATHAPSGWGWVNFLNHGDYLNLIGIAFLGIVSMLGYATLFVSYLRKKDTVYAVMVGIEIVVVVLAASGIIHVGA